MARGHRRPIRGDVGRTVNYANQNGYILYFSDHRGMLPDPNPSNGGQTPAGVISGEVGLEDVVNSSRGTDVQYSGRRERAGHLLHLLARRRRPERLPRQLGRQEHRLRLWRQHQHGAAESVPHHQLRHHRLDQRRLRRAPRAETGGRRHERRHQLSAGARGQQSGRIHRRLRKPGLRAGQLQQRSVRSFLDAAAPARLRTRRLPLLPTRSRCSPTAGRMPTA